MYLSRDATASLHTLFKSECYDIIQRFPLHLLRLLEKYGHETTNFRRILIGTGKGKILYRLCMQRPGFLRTQCVTTAPVASYTWCSPPEIFMRLTLLLFLARRSGRFIRTTRFAFLRLENLYVSYREVLPSMLMRSSWHSFALTVIAWVVPRNDARKSVSIRRLVW